jgi:hypothetical protein
MPENLSQREHQHLEWLFENHPDFVLELDRHNQLRQFLADKEQQALKAEQAMLEAGCPPDEVQEVVSNQILAPQDGPAITQDPAPIPLSLKDQQIILRRLARSVWRQRTTTAPARNGSVENETQVRPARFKQPPGPGA